MRCLFPLALLAALAGCSTTEPDRFRPETIVNLERGALDRWNNGDIKGYQELFAPEITYFDPVTEKRVDGIEAMNAYLAPIAGKIHTAGYEMLNPQVQRHDHVAVLTFNLLVYGKMPREPQNVMAKWNSTEVYSQIGSDWKIIHSHWSYIKPELKQPLPQ